MPSIAIVSGELERGVLEGDAVLIDGEVRCLRSRNTPAARRMAVVKKATP